MILIPLYDDLLNTKKIMGYITYDGSHKAYYRIHYDETTPFYRWEGSDEVTFLRLANEPATLTYYAKNLYKIYSSGLLKNVKDVNTILYNRGIEPVDLEIDGYATRSMNQFNAILEVIDDAEILHNIPTDYSSNYQYLLHASALLDGVVYTGNEKRIKFFDHYTKGHRLRDRTGNTLGMSTEERMSVKTNGFKVLMDLDSFHLRIINELIDGDMPTNVRGHDWLIEQAFGDIEHSEGKKMIFRALYSENFITVPCKFMHKLSKVYKRIQSPFNRDHDVFNYKIQEYESLIVCKYIIDLHKKDIPSVLYIYDGLLLSVSQEELSQALEIMKDTIKYPFTLDIHGKTIKVNYF